MVMSSSSSGASEASAPFWREWWPLVVLGVTAAATVAAVYVEDRLEPKRTASPSAPPKPTSAGVAAFEKVLERGVVDGELGFDRAVTDTLYFHKAFNDARVLGITPTQLASSGRYFGRTEMPVRLAVLPDGSLRLLDGRRRYIAAKTAGAQGILAYVDLYDPTGAVVASRRTVVTLV